MKRWALLAVLVLATAAAGRAEDDSGVSVADFASVDEGRYQVFAQGGHQMAYEVNLFMNEMLRHYEEYFNNQAFKAGARVIVFDNSADFRRYATNAFGTPHPWLAGYCQWKTDAAGNRFCELVVLNGTYVWATLAHEGFHQFVVYELGGQIPVWLNEGLAQYFETSYFTGSTFHVGQINRTRMVEAQMLIKNRQAPTLAQLVRMDPATFYADPNTNYPMSWAFVFYLATSNRGPSVQSEFRSYLQDMRWGGDSLKSAQERFAQDGERWQTDFEEFVLHLSAWVD